MQSIQKLNFPIPFPMNAFMDDEIFAVSHSGIISVLAATGIAGCGACDPGVSPAVKLLKLWVSHPDKLFGLVFSKPAIQLIIETVQKAVNKGPSVPISIDFFSFLMLCP